MQFNFIETMRSNSTEELVKIITTERAGYQDEAVSAAEEELKKRNYSFDEIEKLIVKATILKEAAYKKSLKPLELPYKILTMLFPGLITLILSGMFKSEGYDKKASDLVKWTLYGIGFYIVLTLLLNMI